MYITAPTSTYCTLLSLAHIGLTQPLQETQHYNTAALHRYNTTSLQHYSTTALHYYTTTARSTLHYYRTASHTTALQHYSTHWPDSATTEDRDAGGMANSHTYLHTFRYTPNNNTIYQQICKKSVARKNPIPTVFLGFLLDNKRGGLH